MQDWLLMAWFVLPTSKGQEKASGAKPGEPGENIMMSLIIDPSLKPDQQFLSSAAVALAVRDLVTRDSRTKNRKIKWPNDLYWRDRKAGGILIESVVTGQTWRWAVVGIGLNLNQSYFSRGDSKCNFIESDHGPSI